MKNKYSFAAFAAAIATALMATATSCSIELDEVQPTAGGQKEVSVTFSTPDDGTKVVMDDQYRFSWAPENELLAVSVGYKASGQNSPGFALFGNLAYTPTFSNYTLSEDGRKATFSFNDASISGSLIFAEYYFIYPYSAVAYNGAAQGQASDPLPISFPFVQRPVQNGPDPASVLMYSTLTTSGLLKDAGEIVKNSPKRFTHLNAFAKFKIKNLKLKNGERIESICINFPEKLTKGYEIKPGNPVAAVSKQTIDRNSIQLELDQIDTTGISGSTGVDFWVAVMPQDIAPEDGISIDVITNIGKHVKNIRPESGITFEAGKAAGFGVDMSTATPVLTYGLRFDDRYSAFNPGRYVADDEIILDGDSNNSALYLRLNRDYCFEAQTVTMQYEVSGTGISGTVDVTLAEGQTTAVVPISISGISDNDAHTVEASVPFGSDESASISMKATVRKVDFERVTCGQSGNPRPFNMYEGLLGNQTSGVVDKAVLGDNILYRYSPYNGTGVFGDGQGTMFYFMEHTKARNSQGCNLVSLNYQYTGYDYVTIEPCGFNEAEAPLIIMDWYHYFRDIGYTRDDWTFEEFAELYNETDYNLGFYDSEARTFNMTAMYGAEGVGYSRAEFEIIGSFEYYYYLNTVLGEFNDTYDRLSSKIYYGKDITDLCYNTCWQAADPEAELTDEWVQSQVEYLKGHIDRCSRQHTDPSMMSQIIFDMPSFTANVAIIVLALDENGDVVNTYSKALHYVPVSVRNEHPVELTVTTSDPDEKLASEGITESNAFSFEITSNCTLTDAHAMVVNTREYEKNPSGYALEARNEDYAMSASQIEAINDGGLHGYWTGLVPNTDYTLVVWAYNGYAEGVSTANYETRYVESEWKAIGAGTITDDFIGPLTGRGLHSWSVHMDENTSRPGLYRILDPYGDGCPFYDTGFYDTSGHWYMLIDATDPDHVLVKSQEVGFTYGNYGMASLFNMAEYHTMYGGMTLDEVKEYYPDDFGKLEDGVIRFPVRTMLLQFNGTNSGIYISGKNDSDGDGWSDGCIELPNGGGESDSGEEEEEEEFAPRRKAGAGSISGEKLETPHKAMGPSCIRL